MSPSTIFAFLTQCNASQLEKLDPTASLFQFLQSDHRVLEDLFPKSPRQFFRHDLVVEGGVSPLRFLHSNLETATPQ